MQARFVVFSAAGATHPSHCNLPWHILNTKHALAARRSVVLWQQQLNSCAFKLYYDFFVVVLKKAVGDNFRCWQRLASFKFIESIVKQFNRNIQHQQDWTNCAVLSTSAIVFGS